MITKIKREKKGWIILSEKSSNKIWNNEKDEEIWRKYFVRKKNNQYPNLFS